MNTDTTKAEETLHTYYQIEIKNMPEEWDTTICATLDEVRDLLQYLDIHLDDDTPTSDGEPRQVIITGIPMTRTAYRLWREEYLKERDPSA